jgi:hypothetical protein
MATIGSFKKVGNGFQGEIITLSGASASLPRPTGPTTMLAATVSMCAEPKLGPRGRRRLHPCSPLERQGPRNVPLVTRMVTWETAVDLRHRDL